jgi:hypothetical protein
VIGEDFESINENEIVKEISPDLLFVLFPVLFGILGGLILFWSLIRLPIYYNYLRGAPSPIDQYVLILLGSDLSRLVILIFAIIGIVIGSLFSRFVIKKLDSAKREQEVVLSLTTYIVVFLLWWQCVLIPSTIIDLIEMAFFGYPTSHFLRDLSWAFMSGYFISAGIPIVLKYYLLRNYAYTINSQIILLQSQVGGGLIKRVQHVTLMLVQTGPDP